MSKSKGIGIQKFSRHELKAIKDLIESEDDLQKYLEAGMESEGWDVIRERNPDRSNLRVDLVGIHSEYGKVGIETKYRSDGSLASNVSAAVRQIMEYSSKRYFGEKIDLWVLGIYDQKLDFINSYINDDREKRQRKLERYWKLEELQRLANGFGIGWITLDSDRVVIEFAADTPSYRIPLFTLEERGWPSYYSETEEFDRDTVVSKVQERWLVD